MKKTKKKMKKATRPKKKAAKKRAAKTKTKPKLKKKVTKQVKIKPVKVAKVKPATSKIKNFEKKKEAMLEKGKRRGFVTYGEILKEFPNIEDDILSLDHLYEKF